MIKKLNREQKWIIFWKVFSEGINTKNKKNIQLLTSVDFYDGGGGTVEEWLESEIYRNDKQIAKYKAILKRGARTFKNEDSNSYKATGKNKAGDLFFEYKNNSWLFAGVVGD